jgi:hypothetical protein
VFLRSLRLVFFLDCFGVFIFWIASFLASSFSLAEKMTGLRPVVGDGCLPIAPFQGLEFVLAVRSQGVAMC